MVCQGPTSRAHAGRGKCVLCYRKAQASARVRSQARCCDCSEPLMSRRSKRCVPCENKRKGVIRKRCLLCDKSIPRQYKHCPQCAEKRRREGIFRGGQRNEPQVQR
jgi:hypothetical protein